MEGWLDWQRGYRYGVLLIFPPEPLLSQVNRLRQRHDPESHNGCEAHISLTVPLPSSILDSAWEALSRIAASCAPIEVVYGPVSHYLPHPGVCLKIEPFDQLDRLRIRLESADVFRGAVKRSHPFSPHMTLAEFISVEQTRSLLELLEPNAPEGCFLCRSVDYVIPDEAFVFRSQGTLTLGQNQTSARNVAAKPPGKEDG
ncbi:MAG: 2'-5' RNA ligase family protein [Planctomycetota bacterium]